MSGICLAISDCWVKSNQLGGGNTVSRVAAGNLLPLQHLQPGGPGVFQGGNIWFLVRASS